MHGCTGRMGGVLIGTSLGAAAESSSFLGPKVTIALASQPKPTSSEEGRLDWLDVLRLLCALQIVGFHWLRACFATGAFGAGQDASLVRPYRHFNPGLTQSRYLLIDGQSSEVGARIANDIVGLSFGFGWQAVNVFILLSGLGLALAYEAAPPRSLRNWYGRRLRRILAPYLAVAIPFLAAAFALTAMLSETSETLQQLSVKIARTLNGPWTIEFIKHVFLFDLRQPHWVAEFFAPAWWFIPAIIVAYAMFPIIFACVRRLRASWALAASLSISVTSYVLSVAGILLENAWYFVVLHELFSFVLGIVIGRALTKATARTKFTAILDARSAALAGAALFITGNLANWFLALYPVSSPLYTIGLGLMLGFLAVRLSRRLWAVRTSRRIDPYYLYLLHQPFAFPLAAVLVSVIGSWTTAIGFVFYLVVCAAAVLGFRAAKHRLLASLLSNTQKITHKGT